MLLNLLKRTRWSLIIPALVFAPVYVPVTADASHGAVVAYVDFLDQIKQEGDCPAGTDRQIAACQDR